MVINTFIFDLDMTLLDSSELAEARRSRNWRFVCDNMHKVKPFNLAPHSAVARLRKHKHKIAIVTSSPRWYAMRLLSEHSIPYDLLVAAGDTTNSKPHPEPINKVLSDLSVNPSEAVYIGDDAIDVQAAYRAKVISIGAGWGVQDWAGFTRSAPDILLHNPELLLNYSELEKYQYMLHWHMNADSTKTEKPIFHAGSFFGWQADLPVYALGRYYSTKDLRHAGDELSRQILRFKNCEGDYSTTFGQIAALVIKSRFIGWQPDFIVPVPPKPGNQYQRFERMLNEALPSIGDIAVKLDGLRCIKEVPDYKQKGPEARAAELRGAYVSNYTWQGRDVLLLDDIYTYGATLAECAKALRASGAGEVRALCLARDQESFATEDCPLCGSVLKVKTSVYGQFLGCSAWPRTGCRYKRDI